MIEKLETGKAYGTSAEEIYTELCNSMGFSKSKKSEFGQHKPLYAEYCDTNRKNDVWFICHYEKKLIQFLREKDRLIRNIVSFDKKNIVEHSNDGPSNPADRITFLKEDGKYIFLGVFRLTKNGLTREYERVSPCYPIEQ